MYFCPYFLQKHLFQGLGHFMVSLVSQVSRITIQSIMLMSLQDYMWLLVHSQDLVSYDVYHRPMMIPLHNKLMQELERRRLLNSSGWSEMAKIASIMVVTRAIVFFLNKDINISQHIPTPPCKIYVKHKNASPIYYLVVLYLLFVPSL